MGLSWKQAPNVKIQKTYKRIRRSLKVQVLLKIALQTVYMLEFNKSQRTDNKLGNIDE